MLLQGYRDTRGSSGRIAAVTDSAARVLVPLHGGARLWQVLLLEAGLGARLDIIAAGAAVWWDLSLRDIGWPLLIVASAAGCAGAAGTRLMDVLVAAVERKVGGETTHSST